MNRMLLTLLAVLANFVAVPGSLDSACLTAESTVVLKVKNGDETREFGPIEVAGKITVEKLMRNLAEQDPEFKFEARGEGETFFLTSLLGQANEGRGQRNWVFLVDDRLANRGAGTLEVSGGSVVTWEFRGKVSRSP